MRRSAIAAAVILVASEAAARAQRYGGGIGAGSTIQGDYLRGVGIAAQGMGYYNLSTAQALSINVNTEIRWDEYVAACVEHETQTKAELRAKNRARHEADRAAILARLRDKPQELDMMNGDALNMLLEQLNDPKIHESSYRSQNARVTLPTDLVKRIPFRLNTEAAEFSMNRLIPRGKGKWPVALQDEQFAPEIKAYERAVDDALEQQIGGKMSLEVIRGVDIAVEGLRRKVELVLGSGEDQLRREARNKVRELQRAAELLRSHQVELVLGELDNYHGTTVNELRIFMQKYKLRFAAAGNPEERRVYPTLYESLFVQRDLMADAVKEKDQEEK